MKEKHTQSAVDCPLQKHTTKSMISAVILGVFIGLAVIVPGVSGSTIAIIFGLYTGMLYALGNILADFKRCFVFLLPIGVGVVVGFAAGFIAIQRVFELFLFQLICLFGGLMIGAVPALTKEIKGERLNVGRALLFIIGLLIPIGVSVLSIVLSSGASEGSSFTSFPIWRIFAFLPLGAVVAVTQIVPGLSATAILMAFGQFKPILNSLHTDYIFSNPQVLLLYAALAVGFLVGLVGISKLFSAILKNHKGTAFFCVIGLAFGSIISMFLNSDVYELYMEWGATSVPVTDVIVGIGLLILGFIGSLLLTRYELSKDENAQ